MGFCLFLRFTACFHDTAGCAASPTPPSSYEALFAFLAWVSLALDFPGRTSRWREGEASVLVSQRWLMRAVRDTHGMPAGVAGAARTGQRISSNLEKGRGIYLAPYPISCTDVRIGRSRSSRKDDRLVSGSSSSSVSRPIMLCTRMTCADPSAAVCASDAVYAVALPRNEERITRLL